MKCLLLILLSALASIIINPIHHHAASSFMIIISPPSSAQDYRQLASLLVASFDAPPLLKISSSEGDGDEKVDDSNHYNDKLSKKLQQLQWNLYEKSLTEEFTYKRYVSTVRRMRGKKYCLLVAKKIDESEVEYGVVDSSFGDENEIPSPNYNNGEVVGLVEMGMSLCPSPTTNMTSTSSSENYSSESNSNNNNNTTTTECITPTPLIGVICVSPTHQKEGIAMKLIHKCEEIARDLWQEDFICADVEPTNTRALSLFEMGGYDACLDEDGHVLMRNATILRRRRVEVKPHYLMRKRIRDDDDDNDKADNEVDEAVVNNVSAES